MGERGRRPAFEAEAALRNKAPAADAADAVIERGGCKVRSSAIGANGKGATVLSADGTGGSACKRC